MRVLAVTWVLVAATTLHIEWPVRVSVRAVGSTALGIVLGILVGLRHAFEPDHLTAVSTLVAETHGPRHGAFLGVLWGIGHTISLVVVGTILALVGAVLPARVGVAFELGVAAMLLVLGARAIHIALHPRASHAHGRDTHTHAGAARWRPLFVGLVHGLAGSGALTALVFAQIPSTAARILYMVLFGLGSIVGMAIASGVAGVVLQHAVGSLKMKRRIGIVVGALSIVVGLVWGIPLLT